MCCQVAGSFLGFQYGCMVCELVPEVTVSEPVTGVYLSVLESASEGMRSVRQ